MHRLGRSRHKVSPIGMLVLGALKNGKLSGMEIIKELSEEFSDTSFSPKTGTIYPLLDKLKKNGYIEVEKESEGREKRYTLTPDGSTLLAKTIHRDLKGDMDFSSRFFNFFLTSDFSDFISQISKNVTELSDNIASKFEQSMKDFRVSGLIGEIKRLRKLRRFHEEEIKRIDAKLDQKEKELTDIENQDEEKSYHDIPIK